MISNMSKILYIFLYITPFVFLRYYPFRNKLKKSAKVLCTIYGIIISIQAALFCFLSSQSFWNIKMTQAFRMGFIIFYAILAFILINENLFKQFYIWSLMIAFASFIFANANFIEARFFIDYTRKFPHMVVNLVVFFQIIIFFPFVIKLMDNKIMPLIYSMDNKIWSRVWVIPAILYIGIFSATGTLEYHKVSSISHLMIRHFSFWSMIFVSAVLFEVLKQTDKNARLSENALMMDRQLTLEREYYQMLSDHIEETKRIKHDLRHHLSLIETYLIDNNIEKLKEYIEQYKSMFSPKTVISFCKNYTINVIVSHYYELAQQLDIDIDINLMLPATMNIADSDLCVVLGNLLENAIEACKRQKESNKFIIISAGLAGKNIVITVDNSFEGDIIKEEEVFLSSKRKGKGIGVTSVQAIAQKYDGLAKFEYEKNVFRASVMLKNK